MAILDKNQLEEAIEELQKHKGKATELITVYISAGYDVNVVQSQLEGERGTSKNIKSTSTRKNVTEALDKIIRHLKEFKKTPEHGMALFCGNVAKTEGQTDLQLWSIEPPRPLNVRLYRCDKDFVLDPLLEQLEVEEVFGLIVMDRKEATLGSLSGKRIELIQKMTSGIPSKVRAGGQSSQRFHRITEGLTKDFYKRIASEAKEAFFENKKLKGILIGGPIPTKDEFLDGEYLPTQLQEKVIGRVDIGNTDESGLHELVEKAQDILASQEIIKEKKILERFFETLGKKPDMAVYKENPLKRALEYGAVDLLLLSKELDKSLLKELKKVGEDIGSTVEIISTETDEGKQFLQLGGIGGVLRFKV
jgi:peptide chain release factor subunit 1